MDFVDDVDFIFPFRGGNHGFFAKVADIIDTRVRGGINFDDVEVRIFEFVFKTVDFVRENARNGSFSAAARAGKKIRMRNFTRF